MTSGFQELLSRDAALLAVLGAANFLPILGRALLGERLGAPVDLGRRFRDGRPVFGDHKTWRGLALAVAGGAAVGGLTPFGRGGGALLAALSMAGDLAASFAKRRMGLEGGHPVPLLDHTLESLVPLLFVRRGAGLGWIETAVLVGAFAGAARLFSPVLHRLRLRRRPA
ncbi:CDP-archaeol synthase [Dissulfurirhabdus thermomarina]|uniref:CDP-archaeol synthase n=1 Tax=Dissulfurirhabdus thermomarina TaxID=1765737 RepID=A0A6N9TNW1_DISTH|nr:CDP-archaeol synthase [Dissulfurirhabdus thermomarina]NDY41434.1 CDP-archaeol synthase [Dissulfurirhabdus thermomarina]NMX24422.1 CDP-archaeol synthase [Dissulfurirhabdus thermomarina]